MLQPGIKMGSLLILACHELIAFCLPFKAAFGSGFTKRLSSELKFYLLAMAAIFPMPSGNGYALLFNGS